jgi:hypothetical protein
LDDQHLIRAQRDNATSWARRRRRQARMNLRWLIMGSGMAFGTTVVNRKLFDESFYARANVQFGSKY